MINYTRKSFDKWNRLKQKINSTSSEKVLYPKVGEVWMSAMGQNIGFEQNGTGDNFSRPLLVIHKFNNQMFWAIPLSTKQKSYDFYHNFTDPNNQHVSAIIAQLKLVSVKRLKRKLYDVDHKDFQTIIIKLKSFLI
ncbi:MAG TPA: type II toxin-antitoxin system PemK/MazF family toxin [Patescibacteria group bacterium]|jgi:mRNA interferase MazF|nr:type II toxin-antitoxin system PemK/MazF family toxin [Patescibacteria group bacterium]